MHRDDGDDAMDTGEQQSKGEVKIIECKLSIFPSSFARGRQDHTVSTEEVYTRLC